MRNLLLIAFTFLFFHIHGQSITDEVIEFELLSMPKTTTDASSRNYNVMVESPYNLTLDDVIAESKAQYANKLKEYDKIVIESEEKYQKKLEEHELEVEQATKKYELESEEFKKLSLLERVALTDQGKNPKLVLPSRPVYYKPSPPAPYRAPDLNEYLIIDNNVLANKIELAGFKRGGSHIDIYVYISAMQFQDNTGETYAKQPTQLIVKVNGDEKINKLFFQDYEFIAGMPSNQINQVQEEKNYLTKVISTLNTFLNEEYGYAVQKGKINIQSVKNSKNRYDDLERARIYVTTNLKKLQGVADSKSNEVAFENMQKGIDIWVNTLSLINYQDPKSDFNATIAKFLYFNLIRLHVALHRYDEAEKFLNQMQDNLVYIKLSSSEKEALGKLEKIIYKSKK